MAEEKQSFLDNVKTDFIKRVLNEYNNLGAYDAVEQYGLFVGGLQGLNMLNLPKTAALLLKSHALIQKLATGDKEVPLTNMDNFLAKTKEIQKEDPALYNKLIEAIASGEEENVQAVLSEGIEQAELNQKMKEAYPEIYEDMGNMGNELENNNYTSIEQLQAENAELYEKIGLLEGQIAELAEQLGIQVSQNDVDFVQQPQTQARAGEEKEDKARAIYEKDGVRIEVADGLQPEKAQEELQHGQEFEQAEQEVSEEELAQAEKEVKERDVMTEDGTVSIILNNSKKITISVEPYIAGDKETQMAQEANEQEQIASREESTEITDDTARE